jgi:hypothetical protein
VRFFFAAPVGSVGQVRAVSRVGEIFPGTSWTVNDDVLDIVTGRLHNGQRYGIVVEGLPPPHEARVSIAFAWLVGDVTGDGVITAEDRSAIGLRSGQAVDASNFIFDVSTDGHLNVGDIQIAGLRAGAGVSPFALLTDGSFEYPVVTGSPVAPGGFGWTFSGDAGVHADGGPLSAHTAADGRQQAFIGCGGGAGGLGKTVSFIADTEVRLQLWLAQTDSAKPRPIQIEVNGAVVGRFDVSDQRVVTEPISVHAGENRIEIDADACAAQPDGVALLDRIEWREDGVTTRSAVALTVAPLPPAPGAGFVLSAQVDPLGAGGTVDFREGATVLCAAVPLAGGIAQCLVPGSAATVGAHNYIAAYAGDGVYEPGSSTLSVTIGAGTTLTASVAALSLNQGFTLTATVAAGGASGSVTFTEGGAPLCSAVALSGGTASCAVAADKVSAGAHSYIATYSGNGGGNGAVPPSSGALTLRMNTTTTLKAAPNPLAKGRSAVLTATIAPAGSGTVSFREGATTLCNAVTVSGGTATCALPVFSVTGSHDYSAAYSGDAAYLASSATTTLVVVDGLPMRCALSAPPVVLVGSAATVTASCTATDGGAPIDGANLIWTGCDWSQAQTGIDGAATCGTAPLTAPVTIGVAAGAAGYLDTTASLTVIPVNLAACALSAAPAVPPLGGAAVVSATCVTFDGAPLAGLNLAWNGCAAASATTDAGGIGTCTTAALSDSTSVSVVGTRPGYMNATAALTIKPQNPLDCVLSFSPSNPGVGATVNVSAYGTTPGGVPVAGARVSRAEGASSTAALVNGRAACTTAPLPGPTTVSLLATLEGFAPAVAQVTVTPSVKALVCALAADPAVLLLGGTSTVTATCASNGVALANAPVQWSLSDGVVVDAPPRCGTSDARTAADGTARCVTPATPVPLTVSLQAAPAGYTPAAAQITLTPVFPLACALAAVPAVPAPGASSVVTATCSTHSVALAGVALTWSGCAASAALTDAQGQARCTTPPVQSAHTVALEASAAGYAPAEAALTLAPQAAGPLVCILTSNTAQPVINKTVRLTLTCKRNEQAAAGVPVDWGLFFGGLSAVTTLRTTLDAAADEVRRAARVSATAQEMQFGAIAAAQCTNTNSFILPTPTNASGMAYCDTPPLTAPLEAIAVYADAGSTARAQTLILTPVLPLACPLTADPIGPQIDKSTVLTATCTTDIDTPVAGVNIQWAGCTGQALTDANGRAQCTAQVGDTRQQFSIAASLDGYQSTTSGVWVTPVAGPVPTCTLSVQGGYLSYGINIFEVNCKVNGVPLAGATVHWDIMGIDAIVVSPAPGPSCFDSDTNGYDRNTVVTDAAGKAVCEAQTEYDPSRVEVDISDDNGLRLHLSGVYAIPAGEPQAQMDCRLTPPDNVVYGTKVPVTVKCLMEGNYPVRGATLVWSGGGCDTPSPLAPTSTQTDSTGTGTCQTNTITAPTTVTVDVSHPFFGNTPRVSVTLNPVQVLACTLQAPAVTPAGAPVTVSATCSANGAPAAGVFLDWAGCDGGDVQTDAAGSARCTVAALSAATTVRLAAARPGLVPATATLTLVPGASAATLACALSAQPAAPALGASATLTVQCRAGDGATVDGAQVVWSLNNGGALACAQATTTLTAAAATCTTPALTAPTQVAATVALAGYQSATAVLLLGGVGSGGAGGTDRKSTRLNSSHSTRSRMPSSA